MTWPRSYSKLVAELQIEVRSFYSQYCAQSHMTSLPTSLSWLFQIITMYVVLSLTQVDLTDLNRAPVCKSGRRGKNPSPLVHKNILLLSEGKKNASDVNVHAQIYLNATWERTFWKLLFTCFESHWFLLLALQENAAGIVWPFSHRLLKISILCNIIEHFMSELLLVWKAVFSAGFNDPGPV